MTHECLAPRCRVQIATDMLCCRDHWYRLPQSLRSEVLRAWRAVCKTGASVDERKRAIREHGAVKQRARSYLERVEGR